MAEKFIRINPYLEVSHQGCIRQFLEKNYLSQRELNRLLGRKSASFINSILKSKLMISRKTADKMADLFCGSVAARRMFKAFIVIWQDNILSYEEKVSVLKILKKNG